MVCQEKHKGDDLKLEEEALVRLFGVLLDLVVEDHDADCNEVGEDGAADVT